MKKVFYVLMACIALSFSCTKKEKPEEPPQENETEQTYSLTVSAVRAESFDTRALYIDDPVVKATWAIGEKVKVYKGVAQVGTLTADTEGCGKATLVNCTFTQNSSSNGAGAIGNALGDTELTIEGGNIHDNTAGTNGGGIWNGGKLYMQGTVKVQGNLNAAGLAHNVFLKNDTYITFKQSLTTDSNIGLSHEGATGTCTTGFAAYHSDSGVSPTDFFFADYSTALQLGQTLSDDVCLVYRVDPSNNIKYVVRSWDNGSVVATPASTGQYTLISDATEMEPR